MYLNKEKKELLRRVCDHCDKSVLPKDIDKWLSLYPFKDKVYMFFKIVGSGKNKKYIGACQHCQSEELELKHVKNGQYGTCPHCHKKVRYRNEKFSLYFFDKEYVWYLDPISNSEFVLRMYLVVRHNQYTCYSYDKYEVQRVYVIKYPDCYDEIFIRLYNCSWTLGWWKNMAYSLSDICWTYYKNLNLLLNERNKYCMIKEFAKHKAFYPVGYLDKYYKYPFIELLVKNKMFNLASDIVRYFGVLQIDDSSHSLCDILKVNKECFSFAKKHDIGSKIITGLQFLSQFNISPTMEKCELAFYLSNLRVFSERRKCYELLGFNRVYDYYSSHLRDRNKLCDYFDYLENCIKLGYDIRNTKYSKPHDFKVAHDMAYNRVQSIANAELYNSVKSKLKKYLELAYDDKIYSIVMPRCAEDIVQEGFDMRNCVGTYLGRINCDLSIICFVRHSCEKNKSFYTLELNPRTLDIVQCRGYGNLPSSENKEVMKFVDAWHKKVVLKKMKKVV